MRIYLLLLAWVPLIACMDGYARYLDRPISTLLRSVPQNSFTVEYWIKNNNRNQSILSYDSLTIYVDREFVEVNNHYCYSTLVGWTHVAITYNERSLLFYINGVLRCNMISDLPRWESGHYLLLGGSADSFIDELRIWNTVHLSSIYSVIEPDTALILYYRFDEPDIDIERDRSFYNHHGYSYSSRHIVSTVPLQGTGIIVIVQSGENETLIVVNGTILSLPELGTLVMTNGTILSIGSGISRCIWTGPKLSKTDSFLITDGSKITHVHIVPINRPTTIDLTISLNSTDTIILGDIDNIGNRVIVTIHSLPSIGILFEGDNQITTVPYIVNNTDGSILFVVPSRVEEPSWTSFIVDRSGTIGSVTILLESRHSTIVAVVAICLTFTAILSAVGILLIRERNSSVVKSATLLFCIGILGSVWCGVASLFMSIFEPTPFKCAVRYLAVHAGYVGVVSGLLVKTQRLFGSFSRVLNNDMKVTNARVMKHVMIASNTFFTFMLIGLFTAPFKVTVDGCVANQEWLLATLVIETVLSVCAVFMAFVTRGSRSLFHEARAIARAIYATCGVGLGSLLLLQSFDNDIVEVVCLCVGVMASGSYFLPILYELCSIREDGGSFSAARSRVPKPDMSSSTGLGSRRTVSAWSPK